MVGALVGTYLTLLLLTHLPAFQRWAAGRAEHILSEVLGTEVRVGALRLGLFNRIVVDDLFLSDQSGDTLLAAARVSAKMDVMELMRQRVRIHNVQLYGYDIRLRRDNPRLPYNFQFVIDSLASSDTTTTTPLDLAISSVLVRRGTLRHDLTYEPQATGFDVAHFKLRDLCVDASIAALTDDSLSASFRRLSFVEDCSGLTVSDLDFAVTASRHETHLTGFRMAMPSSHIAIPDLRATYVLPDTAGATPADILAHMRASADIEARVVPSDLTAIYAPLSRLSMPVSLHSSLRLADGVITADSLTIDTDGMHLDADVHTAITAPRPLRAELRRCEVTASFGNQVLEWLSASDVEALKPQVATLLSHITPFSISGHADYSDALSTADVSLMTAIGSITADASMTNSDDFETHVETNEISLATLLKDVAEIPLDNITLVADAHGSLRQGTLAGDVTLNRLAFRESSINEVRITTDLSSRRLKADIDVDDEEYDFRLIADLTPDSVHSLAPDDLMRLRGFVALTDVTIDHADRHLHLNDLTLHNYRDSAGQHIELAGDFIDAHIDGNFSPTTLVQTTQRLLHDAVPSLVAAPRGNSEVLNDDIAVTMQLWNTDPLLALTDIDLRLPEPGNIRGRLRGSDHSLELRADFAHIAFGNETLTDVRLGIDEKGDSLRMSLALQRLMENGPVSVVLNSKGHDDHIATRLSWDTGRQPAMRGTLSTSAQLARDAGGLRANIAILPTDIIVSDTLWSMKPSTMSVGGGRVAIDGFEVSQMGRHLRLNGVASHSDADTLYAHLLGIDLQYVFGIIDFHEVEFAGLATGNVAAHGLMERPIVDADLVVEQLYLNDGLMGHLHALGGWGRKGPRSIDLDCYITEPDRHLITRVNGIVTPGHASDSGLDLSIFAANTNIYFINDFTRDIFDNMQGRASGYCRLFGPFGQLDIEGAMRVDTAAVTLGVLGARYNVVGDSIRLSPGRFDMKRVRVRDSHYGTDGRDHYALLTGRVTHDHFKDITYDFNVEAHDVLGYDFRDFGDQVFYGTVFANGDVHVWGQPGRLDCDITAHPTAGTVFTYNASSPDAITDSGFITFKSPSTPPPGDERQASSADEDATAQTQSNDIHINFDLDIGTEATMRLLMDPRSEDYITLAGDGHIRANFYNKGRFLMYGTYRVDHGTYRLSLQDVIRKDFHFEQGGSITFGGAPLKGDLRLKAVHTVPSVSLNDLATGSNFSNSSVRVNCIMSITGQAGQPQVSFDFDIPNVNEDEKQMVRSLISTDEERNMQVLYLLGIGRFYTYGLATEQEQTGTAVNSLLSSTLSGQLNDLLTSAIGSAANNWNFGTNLSTGSYGWSSMDVEGMLSGRLLNNRLLINGTFGYRDTPVANTNFIGDFDVQWLLTPSGTIRLKGYSETNDRYFTKSALTTQGIGIQLRKDFNSLGELFRRR